MSTKLLIRKTAANPPEPTCKYVEWHLQHPHPYRADLSLPSESVVRMVDELMLRVQARIHPKVSWQIRDSWILRYTTLQWSRGSTMMQLQASLNHDGFSVYLTPWFRGDVSKDVVLSHWMVYRYDGRITPEDRGQLEVLRHIRNADCHTTSLAFEDPALDGIPRRRPYGLYRWEKSPELPQLEDDIVNLTREYLQVAGISR